MCKNKELAENKIDLIIYQTFIKKLFRKIKRDISRLNKKI